MIENFAHSQGGEAFSLKKPFLLALAGHFGIAMALFAINLFFDLDWFDNFQDKELKMLQAAVRVDVVAMPKFTAQELKHMDPQAPSKGAEEAPVAAKAAPANPSPSKVEFKKTKGETQEKKVELSSLLGALSEKKLEQAEPKNKGTSKAQKELAALVMEGNRVSKGQTLVGDALKAEEGAFVEYVSSLPGHIQPFWKLPSYLIDKGLRARIRIYISENGRILKTEVYETSGVAEFDQRALSALKQTGALPPPDTTILRRLTRGDVILGFPL